MALTITPYKGQGWTDDSTPDLCAETLNAVDAGITANSNAINAIANAVVSQIVNDPNKIASMAALYAVNSNLGSIKYITLTSTTEPQNKPYEYIQSIWQTLPLNTLLFVNVINGSMSIAIIQKYSTHEYGSLIIFGYSLTNPIYGRIANGVWQPGVTL